MKVAFVFVVALLALGLAVSNVDQAAVGSVVNSITQGSHVFSGPLTFVNTTSIGWFFQGVSSIQARLLTQTCAAGKYLTGIGDSVTSLCCTHKSQPVQSSGATCKV